MAMKERSYLNRQQKAYWVLPIAAFSFGLTTLMMASSESCKTEPGTSMVCPVGWMKLPDDYASSS